MAQKKAEKTQKPETSSKQKKDEKKQEQTIGQLPIKTAALVIIIIALAILVYFYLPTILSPNVPFSTFKSNLQSAPRISISATYSNQSQYANETTCFTSIVQVLSHSRQPSTIDFYLIDSAAKSCTYSTTGLGNQVNPVTTNSSYCLSMANAQTGVFLNFSKSNYTKITPTKLYVYGNYAYMASCPIAVSLN